MRFSPTPWLIAALAFVILGFSRGLHSSFGVFYVALLDTYGWSRGATAGVFSVVLTVDAVLSPIVGYLLDRYGTKKITAAGCLALAAGLLLSSSIHSLWQLYIFFGLVAAVGITFTGMVPHIFLISEWFASNRASAIGFVYAGTGVGILLLAPMSEWLLSNFGWARAFQLFSAIVLFVLLPLVWFFYQHGPYGQKLKPHRETAGDANQWTAMLALRSLQFWLLFFARICAAAGTTVIVAHQVAHVVDVGYSKLLAASIFGFAGITSSFGRVVFGFIADMLSKQAAYTLNILMTLVGVGSPDDFTKSESNLVVVRLRNLLRYRIRLAGGNFFRADGRYLLGQGFWIDTRLLHRGGRRRRRARFLSGRRVLRLDGKLSRVLRAFGDRSRLLGYLHLARVDSAGCELRPEALADALSASSRFQVQGSTLTAALRTGSNVQNSG